MKIEYSNSKDLDYVYGFYRKEKELIVKSLTHYLRILRKKLDGIVKDPRNCENITWRTKESNIKLDIEISIEIIDEFTSGRS